MNYIEGYDANNLFIQIANKMLSSGHRNSPRGLETIELSDLWLKLNDPAQAIVTLPERNINMDYLKGELKWYESGSLYVKDIEKHSSFWKKIANNDGTINSNYGYLAKKEQFNDKSQLEWCIDKLLEDSNTRQAVINYNQPRHKYNDNRDFVCTISQQFIKRDNKLDSITLMRSNDLIYGLTYDLPWFTRLQEEVSNKTKIPLGYYNHYTASMHVYKKHFKMLEQIAELSQK